MVPPTIKSVLTAVRFSASGITAIESLFPDPDDLANHFAEHMDNEDNIFDGLPSEIHDKLTDRNKFQNLVRFFFAAAANNTNWLTIDMATFTTFKSGQRAQHA